MAGAGYKLFNTGDVLTAAQVNTYLQEQVVMVFADATARTAALSGVLAEGMVSYLKDTNATEVYDGSNWVAIGNSGDITGITTGATSGLTGGVTSGTADLKLNTTAKGGLLVGTGSGTVTELAVGTNAQILTADSSTASGLKWTTPSAGGSGLTLITSTNFSNSTSIQVNNCFSSTYRNYRILLQVTAISANSTAVYFRYSSSGTPNSSGIYSQTALEGGPTQSPTAYSGRNLTATQFDLMYYDPGYSPNNQMPVYANMDVFAPNVGQYQKGLLAHSFSTYATSPINTYARFVTGTCLSNSSFDGFQIRPQGSDGITGTLRVYGYQD